MSFIIRKSTERGKTDISWLQSQHTFSFGSYHDTNFTGFGCLRVINEDIVQARQGFGQHAHHNMEIISYVVSGALQHQDSLGNGSIIYPGEIQRMSAGRGINHSELNPSSENPLHFMQIWIVPNKRDTEPVYEQVQIKQEKNKLVLIGSPIPQIGAVAIDQDIYLFVAYLDAEKSLEHEIALDRLGWVQVIQGSITINGIRLFDGDGLAIQNEQTIIITGIQQAQLLLFDMIGLD